MLTKKEPKEPKIYTCITCDFSSSKISSFERHLSTRKHLLLTSLTEKEPKEPTNICSNCDKEYKSREGLWYHSKKCKQIFKI